MGEALSAFVLHTNVIYFDTYCATALQSFFILEWKNDEKMTLF